MRVFEFIVALNGVVVIIVISMPFSLSLLLTFSFATIVIVSTNRIIFTTSMYKNYFLPPAWTWPRARVGSDRRRRLPQAQRSPAQLLLVLVVSFLLGSSL